MVIPAVLTAHSGVRNFSICSHSPPRQCPRTEDGAEWGFRGGEQRVSGVRRGCMGAEAASEGRAAEATGRLAGSTHQQAQSEGVSGSDVSDKVHSNCCARNRMR